MRSACASCRQSKLKCDEIRPCSKCTSRARTCQDEALSVSDSPLTSVIRNQASFQTAACKSLPSTFESTSQEMVAACVTSQSTKASVPTPLPSLRFLWTPTTIRPHENQHLPPLLVDSLPPHSLIHVQHYPYHVQASARAHLRQGAASPPRPASPPPAAARRRPPPRPTSSASESESPPRSRTWTMDIKVGRHTADPADPSDGSRPCDSERRFPTGPGVSQSAHDAGPAAAGPLPVPGRSSTPGCYD